MNREQDSAVLESSLEPLGFVLRNTHSYERPDQSADGSADAKTRQRTHDRTRRDERSHSRNGQRADAGEKTQRPSDRPARGDACRRALRRFGVLLMGEFLRTLVVGPAGRKCRRWKNFRSRVRRQRFSLCNTRINAKNGGLLVCHVILLDSC